jgi:hypothetical protein
LSWCDQSGLPPSSVQLAFFVYREMDRKRQPSNYPVTPAAMCNQGFSIQRPRCLPENVGDDREIEAFSKTGFPIGAVGPMGKISNHEPARQDGRPDLVIDQSGGCSSVSFFSSKPVRLTAGLK